ncbi:PA14 domain-containing protein [Methylomonas methanica]|uniref:PA14 domain protein n=1 Tax=Methylomonas methanica (strain DSM 25384 / MC09) TaxID=857087 RepID=G0A250_METMM|nr:PA14 domain-containing protein [Methylomonas methanica]AEG02593.1 PA14 domain protein [Methylomonas methanica MC09]
MNHLQSLRLGIGILAIAASSAGYACDAPVGSFCVDFFKGAHLAGKPLATRKAPFIKYNWANRSPARHIPYDNFSARWRGWFEFKDGPYELRALADEGVRIMLDGQSVLDHWDGSAGAEDRVQVSPGAGTHLVEVEYYEATGNALLQVSWKSVKAENVMAGQTQRPKNKAIINPKYAINQPKPAFFGAGKIHRGNKAPLGINLSPFNYWSSSVPFKDLLMQNGEVGVYQRGTKDQCKHAIKFDVEGYPTSLPKSCVFRIWSVFHIPDEELGPKDIHPYPSGRYVLTYQGQGDIRLGWDATTSVKKAEGRIEFDIIQPYRGIQIEVSDIDPNNPVKDMHLVHITDEATYQQQPFNEKWLSLLEPFSVIRFKDWGRMDELVDIYHDLVMVDSATDLRLPSASGENTAFRYPMVAKVNIGGKISRVFVERYDASTRTLHLKTPIDSVSAGAQVELTIYDFVNVTWEQRARPSTLTQASSKGLAFETMIQLANLLEADPWISVPTAADDDFVVNLATTIKNRLKPGLKCYVEYSNETWNFIYPGYAYSEAKTRQLELQGALIPADAWHAYRATEIFKIFNRVFGEADLPEARQNSRLVRVLTAQTAYFKRAKSVMDWKMPGNAQPTDGLPAYKFADAWASTAYFGFKDDKDGTLLERSSFDELIDLQLDDINSMFGTKSEPGILRQLFQEANARGMQFITYEAGAGIVAPAHRKDLIIKAGRLNQDQGMHVVYNAMFQKWSELYQEYGADSIGVWTQYYDVGRYGKSGYWGLLQSTYQDPVKVPKYQAVLDYVSGQE